MSRSRLLCCWTLSLVTFIPAIRTLADQPAMDIPKPGQPAPELSLTKLLQAPDGASADWASLRGKVVVLEFWATTCGPCVQLIPYMNKLEERFEGKPIVFLSITPDDEATVSRFLRKRPMLGWIGFDNDGATRRAYGIHGIPRAAIVGKDGRLLGWTIPHVLVDEPSILDDILAGKPTTKLSPVPHSPQPDVFADVDEDEGSSEGKNAAPPLCQIVVRPARGLKRPLYGGDSRGRRFDDATMRTAIAHTYGVPGPYVIGNLPDKQKYDVVFRTPGMAREARETLMQTAIQASFGVRVERETRSVPVYVLSVPEGVEPTLEAGMSRLFFDQETNLAAPTKEVLERRKSGEKFFMALGASGPLATNLSWVLDRPVIDEADIEGYYYFYFPYDMEKPDHAALIRSVRDKYGLALTPATREVEILVVTNDR